MSSDEAKSGARTATYALLVLTLVNFFNYVDRWVIGAVVESIKRSELALSDAQLGVVGAGFIIVYTVASPIFGALGDRRSRPPLIALGVVIWSLATASAAFARGFWSLFAARALVGVGEGAYGTIAPPLLADHFAQERRGRVFAMFFAAIPVGSAAGYILGGLVDHHFGWRAAFLVAGIPGLLLAALVWRVGEPRPAALPDARHARRSTIHVYKELLGNRPYVLAVAGYAAYTFALGGLAFWMPAFLERVRGMERMEATTTFGAIAVVTGFAGTFAGGWLADSLLKKTPHANMWVSGVATLAAAPLTYVALSSPHKPVYLTAIVLAEVLIFMSTGPVNSAIVGVVPIDKRATAVGLSVFAMHFLGDIPSPPLIGAISDRSSLEQGFLVVPVAVLVAGMIWTYAAVSAPAE